MNELKAKIHDEAKGIDYVLVVVYYVSVIELPEGDDCPIGRWGRMHRAYLEETNPLLLNHLILTGRLHSYLANLNEQAQERLPVPRPSDDGGQGHDRGFETPVTEWVKAMNSIASRTEEIIKNELIYT